MVRPGLSMDRWPSITYSERYFRKYDKPFVMVIILWIKKAQKSRQLDQAYAYIGGRLVGVRRVGGRRVGRARMI